MRKKNDVKRYKGGFMARFIDVGLLILFGFLQISQITETTQIVLPGDAPEQEEQQNEDKKDPAILILHVTENHTFSIDDVTSSLTYDNLENITFVGDQLRSLQHTYDQTDTKLLVLIEPDETSPIQLTVDALDKCAQMNIDRNINIQGIQL